MELCVECRKPLSNVDFGDTCNDCHALHDAVWNLQHPAQEMGDIQAALMREACAVA